MATFSLQYIAYCIYDQKYDQPWIGIHNVHLVPLVSRPSSLLNVQIASYWSYFFFFSMCWAKELFKNTFSPHVKL